MPALKALLWDVDGTLAETERDGHRPAFNQAFAETGLDWHWDVARYGELLAITGGKERILHDLRQRQPGIEVDGVWLRRIADLHRRKNTLYARIMESGRIALRPGVARLVAEARRSGLRQAIVTTTSRDNLTALFRAHPESLLPLDFAVAIHGEDVRAKKPDPEAYLLALTRLGLAADEVLAVEDSIAGLSAAGCAGIRCLLTPGIYTRPEAVAASNYVPIAVVYDLEHRCATFPAGVNLPSLEQVLRRSEAPIMR